MTTAEARATLVKGVVLGVALAMAIALVAAWLLVRSGLLPANADAKPGALELWMATTSLEATLRREAPKEQNPVAPTEQNLIEGVRLFARNCAVCHGSAQGVASPSPIARGLYQKPPQLATDGVEDDPEGESFWKIKHGIRLTAMPSFGYTFDDRQIWTLALFLRHMDSLPPAAKREWEQVRNWPMPMVGLTAGK